MPKIWSAIVMVSALCCLVQARGATLPASVQSVSSEFNVGATDRRAIHAVDGSGLEAGNPQGHTNQPNGLMWLNTGDGSFGGMPDPHPSGDLAQITFDLGGLSLVDSFRVWNYNELNGFNIRSVKTLTISIASSASGPYTLLTDPLNNSTTWTFDEAPGTDGYTGQLFTLPTSFTAEFVRFDILTNYDSAGTDHGFVGLSEIQFYGAPVPEPVTCSLLAIGFVGVFLSRRLSDNHKRTKSDNYC
jgi:hypothetical protein